MNPYSERLNKDAMSGMLGAAAFQEAAGRFSTRDCNSYPPISAPVVSADFFRLRPLILLDVHQQPLHLAAAVEWGS
jgi:hypothetical protein